MTELDVSEVTRPTGPTAQMLIPEPSYSLKFTEPDGMALSFGFSWLYHLSGEKPRHMGNYTSHILMMVTVTNFALSRT